MKTITERLYGRGNLAHSLRRSRLKRRRWLLFGLLALQPLVGQLPGDNKLTKPVIPPFQAQVPGTALEQPVDLATYLTGPGDVFLVSIVGLQDYIVKVTIGPAEILVLPDVGTVETAGLSAGEVVRAVETAIREVYPGFVASCSLYGIRELRISVAGAVSAPGLYNVTPVWRLTDALTMAGGWRPTAALHRLILQRQGTTRQVDILHFLQTGDMESNPFLREGDRLVVPFAAPATEMILVGGLAAKPRYYAIRPGEPLSAFLARWFDADSLVDLSNLVVRRGGTATGDITVAAADYTGFLLQPGDALYINTIAGVMVVGEVEAPGRYEYYPGYRASDYVSLASGTSPDGAVGKVIVTSKSGERRSGGNPLINAGDTVRVPPSLRSVLVGKAGLVQVALAILNMYLAFLAATR